MPTVYTPPVSTYVPLATITLTSTDSEIVFSSIPATYRDLVLVVIGSTSTATNPRLRFNGDSASNGSYVFMAGNGSTTGSGANTDAALIGGLQSSPIGSIIAHIMDYSATDKHKTILSRGNNTGDAVFSFASRWPSTVAVNSVGVLNQAGVNWNSGTTFSLFGIQA